MRHLDGSLIQTVEADGAVSASTYGKFTGPRKCAECGAGDVPEVVFLRTTKTGKDVDVMLPGGHCEITVSAGVDCSGGSKALTSKASGKAGVAVAGEIITGYAYETAAADTERVMHLFVGQYGGVYDYQAAEKYPAITGGRFDDCSAGAAVTTYVFTAPVKMTLKALFAGLGDIAVSTLGTVVLDAKKWDKSADAEVDLLASTLDLETVVAKEGAPCTLHGTPANLVFEEGDVLYFVATSDNGDMTGGTDGVYGAKWLVDES